MGQGWFVTAGRWGDSIVTIEEKSLSGKPDFTPEDQALVRGAALHLLAFIGQPTPVEPAGAHVETLRQMLRDEEQENTTLRETLQAAWCELIQHDDQPWVKTLAGQVRVVGLFAFPRPQESQP
jgi:hypothetical protein